MLSCYSCEHRYQNRDPIIRKRINGKWIKAGDCCCGYWGQGNQMKRIGNRDMPKGRHHPAWCPRYPEGASCLSCGKVIYEDQGVTCPACRRKGL